jgi:hypothetical protein
VVAGENPFAEEDNLNYVDYNPNGRECQSHGAVGSLVANNSDRYFEEGQTV